MSEHKLVIFHFYDFIRDRVSRAGGAFSGGACPSSLTQQAWPSLKSGDFKGREEESCPCSPFLPSPYVNWEKCL